MNKFVKTKFAISFLAVMLMAQPALADVYGFQLTIFATNMDQRVEIPNGGIVTDDLILNNKLNFTLSVIDPSDPKKVLKVDQWTANVFDENGVKLSNFVLRDQAKTDNTYQVLLDSLADKGNMDGQTVVVKAQAWIGSRGSNEVSFKVKVAGASDTKAPTLKAEKAFTIGWWLYLLIGSFLIYLFILFYKRRKKDEEKKDERELSGTEQKL